MLRKIGMATAVAVIAAAVQLTGATSAMAGPGQGTPTVVSLGDSFIAGEGGRFAGMADNPATDRGVGIYGNTLNWADGWGTHEGGCHRSDSAPIFGAPATFQRINLACSGAMAPNVWRADSSGVSFKSEQPQATQLISVAQNNNVKAVVLSIGGNDVGFGDVVHDCVQAYILTLAPCRNYWDGETRARMGTVIGRVEHAIADIRTTMTNAGYGNNDYRLIVESYPSPLPAKADLRGNNSGCQIYGDDVEWVSTVMVPRLAGAIRQAVRNANATSSLTNAQFLDLSGAFKGHELCNKNAQFSTTGQPARNVAEWANWINFTSGTNRTNESGHPNFFGQLALQDCLNQMLNASSTGNFRCANDPGAGQVGLALHPLGTIWSSYAPAQVLSVSGVMNGGTCINATTNQGRLCFQTDGNLVNYRGSTAIWASNTVMTGMNTQMRTDGNLVVASASGQVLWQSGTGGNPDSELVVTDTGFAQILNPGGTVLWTTASSGGGSPGGPGGNPGGPPRREN